MNEFFISWLRRAIIGIALLPVSLPLGVTGSIEDAGLAGIGAIGLPAGSSPIGFVVATH